ncbi:MAG: hypothetical protein EPN21_16650 [Methylococcaceae bacterium]|nr:MAG: hypothetical protein EPN21_16650 [Methylococcaceae bacterium]
MPAATAACNQQAERYNRDCHCITLDREALRSVLLAQTDGAALYRMMIEERPFLFADSPVFVPSACIQRQARIIDAVESVIALPAYRERVLQYAPEAARFTPKAKGVFLGYDFHLGAAGPQLIEINTNAGGALLNALLVRAQTPCLDVNGVIAPTAAALTPESADAHALERTFLAMFKEEWRLERGAAPLRTIAIVDEQPGQQFLFPEFLLFQQLFRQNGIDAVICDPGELLWRDGGLRHGERRIDLVYNRLTDFGLAAASSQNLRAAYLAGEVVLTPHPYAHALYADKRNLIGLTDEAVLRELGVDAATRELLLSGIAHTMAVRREDADALWAARKRLFFKPAAGYGSKAAYRGDKLTRRVFEEIFQGDYVAQTLVMPSERRLTVGAEAENFKLDLRNYVYQGQVQLIATRLYQGQTTNFRTPGGGFAPVIVLPCD